MKLRLQIRSGMLFAFLMMLFSVWGWAQTTIFSENMGASSSGNISIATNSFQNSSLTFTGDTDTRITNPSSGYTGASGVRSVYFTNVAGKYFTISGIDASSYGNLALKFGFYKSSGSSSTISSNQFVVEVATDYNPSNNTGTFTVLGYNTISTGSTWSLVEINSGTIPSSATLAIRFRYATVVAPSTQIRIDDVVLTGTPCTAPATPSGTISGTQTACNSTTLSYAYGSGEQNNGLSYYWQNSATGTNNNASNLASNPLNVTVSGDYFVRAYNGSCWSAPTSAFPVVINNLPTIISQPANKTAYVPATATFNVAATNVSTYQWQVDKNDGNGFENVTDGTGGTTDSYTTEPTTMVMDGYQYQVVLTNSCGTTISSPAILTTLVPPVNDQCSSATVLNPGDTISGTLVNSTGSSTSSKKDVWYVFVPTVTGQHIFTVSEFKTAPNNANSDVDIQLHEGNSCSSMSYLTQSSTSNNKETITWDLMAGVTYYLRVLAYNSLAESSTFTVVAPQPCVTPIVATSLILSPSLGKIDGTFTTSNAAGYMVVISQNSTLSASPVNGVKYNVGDSFGGGTVVKYSAGTAFTATGLSNNSSYYAFVYSYNNQCIGEPYYSTTSVSEHAIIPTTPCFTEDFSSNARPAGWIDSATGITYNSGYADMSVNTGSITTSAFLNPAKLTFDLSRTSNTTSKILYVEVSTTSQTDGFTILDTFTHANTTSGGTIKATIDLSAYSEEPNVFIRFRKDQGTTSPWRIDNIQISCGSTSWDGTGWSSGNPGPALDAVITGSYSTAANPAFTAKNIRIKNGGSLEMTSGNTVSAVNVTVENGGNLVQRDGATLNYSGAFKVLKNGTSEVNKYAFWSSPVASQNLSNIYGNGNTPQFITEYNTVTDYFVNAASTTSVFAKGYSIKTPLANAVLSFEGAPNNGTQTFTLATAGNGFNLIGNPYPSSLDLDTFYNTNSARISNAFYFWDNKSNSVTTQGGASTTNIGYATYNPLSSAWVPAPNISAVPSGNVANIGQGFIVQTRNASVDTSLTFNNDMRGNTNGSFFNKTTNNTNEGKFWLRLNSSYNTSNTFAVAYLNTASDSYDNYDSKAIAMGSDAFYTFADAQKLIIQGKGSFDNNDVVAVGAKHFENGNFSISLVQKEGLFDNGQAIYLHDKVTGTYTDLQNNSYSFTANAGETADRFEIVYKRNVLSISEAQKDAFEVYRDGEDFFVRNDKNIEKVEIFDASGRKIQDIDAQSKVVRLQLESKGVYIIKAVSKGKEYTKKIIK